MEYRKLCFEIDTVPITNNPYQGLKPIDLGFAESVFLVPITNNPYQGLKLDKNLEDVLKVLGEYNSLLHKQSPPAWTNEKVRFLTRAGGFGLYSRDFQSPGLVIN